MTEARKELIRLVELDYERTATFINGVTATSATIRGWAITIWLAIIGITLDRGQPQLALVAILVALAFLLIDGYHAWLYGEALAHATTLERLSARYYNSLGRGLDDDEVEFDLRVDLESHRFGMYRNLKRFTLKDLRYVRPAIFFRMFYPLLIMISLAVAVVLWVGGPKQPPCSVVRQGDVVTVDCGGFVFTDSQSLLATPLPSPSESLMSPMPTPSAGTSTATPSESATP